VGSFLSSVQIIGGPTPFIIGGIAIAAVAVLAFRRRPRGKRLSWAITVAIAAIVGALIGLVACWLVSDVAKPLEVSLTPSARGWLALAFAAISVAIVNIPGSRLRRKMGALVAIMCFALVAAIGVNADFGQYPTLGSIVDASSYTTMPTDILQSQRAAASHTRAGTVKLWQNWNAPPTMPTHGTVGTVTIPATISNFAARAAYVYLPPAALVATPPPLPVLIMLAGQPGSPQAVFVAGRLAVLLDSIAAQHQGLAPIVVVPDQLSAPDHNPMCVDSPLGNSATYLSVDVPNWIRANFSVQVDPSRWAIAGFSQGGTCSIQLAAAHPHLFGTVLDICGELAPSLGSETETIARGFHGDAAAYRAEKPLALLASRAPYANSVAIFGAGQFDATFAPFARDIAAAASRAGMQTSLFVSPGSGHDWSTVRYTLERGLPIVFRQMGLTEPGS
jgi:enterochelin esterase-like enzyme